MTDTHARQQAGSPHSIGGQFKATQKSETNGLLIPVSDETALKAERDMLTAFRNADGPVRRARDSAVRAIDTAIQAKLPKATQARFERQLDSQTLYLTEVSGKDGVSLWTEEEDGQWDEVDSFIGMLDDDADQYLRRTEWNSSSVEALTLDIGSTNPRNNAIGIHTDSLMVAADQLADRLERPVDPSTTTTFDNIANARAALDRIEYTAAVDAIATIARAKYPTAAELVLDDRNYDGEGSPYWGPEFLLDGDGHVLWDNGSDDVALENDLYGYTPLLDRLGDPTLPTEPGSAGIRHGIRLP